MDLATGIITGALSISASSALIIVFPKKAHKVFKAIRRWRLRISNAKFNDCKPGCFMIRKREFPGMDIGWIDEKSDG